jgi:hypothetical protein
MSLVTPDAAQSLVAERLQQAGFELAWARIGNRDVLVGRTAKFRWRWFATRMHFFVFLTCLAQGDGELELNTLLAECQSYAIANKGGMPRGLQNGTMAIPVLFGMEVNEEVARWAASRHAQKYAAMTWSAAADTAARTVYQPGRGWIGAVYIGYVRRLVNELVLAPITAA